MRITKDQARSNRDRVIATASQLFRERGFENVSVADLMKASGFSHGGFYNHFASKDDLVTEALEHAFANMAESRAKASDLSELGSAYLSDLHRRSPGGGCPAAALAGDTSRATDEIRSRFGQGIEEMIRSLEDLLASAGFEGKRRLCAVDLLCSMVGALALARAVPESNSLATEILGAARERFNQLQGAK